MKEVLGVKLFTLREVGELLGIQQQTVSKYVAQGKIKARIIGGAKYVSEENLREFVQESD